MQRCSNKLNELRKSVNTFRLERVQRARWEPREESHPFLFVRDLCKIRSGNGLWKRIALIVFALIALGGVVGFRRPGKGPAI
jgi:hypothetical protein